MSALSRGSRTLRAGGGALRAFASPSCPYGRSPAYRRLSLLTQDAYSKPLQQNPTPTLTRTLDATLADSTPQLFRPIHLQRLSASLRHFQTQSSLSQQPRPKEEPENWQQQEQDKTSAEETAKSQESSSEAKSEQTEGEGKEEQSEKEGEQNEGGEKKGKEEEAPPHGDKSPWQVFTDTLRTEFKASKEWNESTKALGTAAHNFTQNETLKKAQSAYGTASDVATTTTAKALKGTGKVIGQSAAWTWDTAPVKGIRAGVNATGRGIEKVTRPMRNTEAYKSVSNVIDDGSSSRYGGWVEKEERKLKREARELEKAVGTAKAGGRPVRNEVIEEDPDAGTNITVHKDAAWKESWRTFRDSSRVMQSLFSLKHTYNESENPLITTARSISDRVAGFFAENETATVIKKFREMDPNFQLEPFLQDMREYILPEVLDAYVKGDVETLKVWLSDAQFQVYSALMHQYTTAGLKSDGRILDIRHVDILSARVLDPGDIPVFILTCRTQEVHVYRNQKTNELAAGMEDRVQQVTYAIGVTRIPEDVSNTETRGWRLIELQKSARDYM